MRGHVWVFGSDWSSIGVIGRIGHVGRKGEDPGNDEVPRRGTSTISKRVKAQTWL